MTTLLDGLQRYYRLDGNGTEEVSAQNGVPSGPITYPAGKRGTAASFDADNTRNITAPGLDLVSDVSISAWVYPTNVALANYRVIVGHGTSHTGVGCNYFLTLLGTTFYLHGTSGAVNPSYSLTANTWTHVVATRTAAGVAKFYINGAPVVTPTTAVPQTSVPAGGVYIGCSPTNTDSFPGIIDEVAIYNTVLSQNQVIALFGEGTPPDYTNFGDPLPELNVYMSSGLSVQSYRVEEVVLSVDLSCHSRGIRAIPDTAFGTMDPPAESGRGSNFNSGIN